MLDYYLTIVLAPLLAAVIAGLFGKQIGRAGAHWVTILGVGLSCVLSCYVLYQMLVGGAAAENISLYTWAETDGLRMEIGFLVDRLTALMMVVVTFVSLMVHVYTVGYMSEDPGYASPYNNLAFLLAETGGTEREFREGLDLVGRALGIDEHPTFMDTQGWLHCRLGEVETGLQVLRRAQSIAPWDDEITGHVEDCPEAGRLGGV